jgi:hypothetical protein
MVQASRPAISVVMIVGTNRENAQGVLDALGRQSCVDDLLEIIVQDLVAVMAFLFWKLEAHRKQNALGNPWQRLVRRNIRLEY